MRRGGNEVAHALHARVPPGTAAVRRGLLRFLPRGFGRCVVMLACAAVFSDECASQNAIRWTTNYYSVTGADLREVRRSMNEARPWKRREDHDAITAWSVTWSYQLSPSGQGCQLSAIQTTTTITTTLPRYVAPTNAPPELRERWSKYFQALSRHEAQHGANALAAAAKIQARLAAGGSGRDCESARRELDGAARAIIEQHRRNDRELDERTRHGTTDGARFP